MLLEIDKYIHDVSLLYILLRGPPNDHDINELLYTELWNIITMIIISSSIDYVEAEKDDDAY